MKVLYLTPWYPSNKDAMSGLFVQKHVEAVRAQGVDVRVISSVTWRELLHEWHSFRKDGWLPDVVQLNVIQKQGLLALWLKRHYSIPYIIVEHWSGYLPESGIFNTMPAFKNKLYKFIASQASVILTVSDRLEKAMKDCGIQNAHWGRINNVVDDFFFEEKPRIKDKKQKTLLHVSCFDERAKNVKSLLRAAKMLSEKRQDWRLVLVGTGVDYKEVRDYAESLDIPDGLLKWTAELQPKEVAEWMYKADAIVLSSRYETYGIILAEAAVTGLPVLSTPVGIAEEIADLIVPQEIVQNKPGRFAEFIETILWGKVKKSKSNGVKARFSPEIIGKTLKGIYAEIQNL